MGDWTRTELYFGVGDEKTSLPEGDWERFLAEEVHPRFPDGVTFLPGTGSWNNRSLSRFQSLRMVILLILHQDGGLRINEIRDAWKRLYPCESVMRVDSHVEVSF